MPKSCLPPGTFDQPSLHVEGRAPNPGQFTRLCTTQPRPPFTSVVHPEFQVPTYVCSGYGCFSNKNGMKKTKLLFLLFSIFLSFCLTKEHSFLLMTEKLTLTSEGD